MVVTIWTEQPRPQVARKEFFRRGEESFGGEDFRRFFGQPPGFDRNRSGERNEDQDEQERTPLAATGTGLVIDDDGLILTNNHVVEKATSIQIRFYGDDERYAARVLGRDRLTDSALLELVERPARKLPAARFGDSSRYTVPTGTRTEPYGGGRRTSGARPMRRWGTARRGRKGGNPRQGGSTVASVAGVHDVAGRCWLLRA